MDSFFSAHKTIAPAIPLGVHIALIVGVLIAIVISLQYYQSQTVTRFFRALQWVQVIVLYSWYVLCSFEWSISLPLYHCRIAMFAILLVPNHFRFKQYFALMGVFGSIVSFIYPVLDVYDFPHVTQFSFIVGHYALLINSLIYLLQTISTQSFSLKKCMYWILGMNAVLVIVNQLTGGDYGFLTKLPLLNTTQVPLNYSLLSIILIIACYGVHKLLQWYYQTKITISTR